MTNINTNATQQTIGYINTKLFTDIRSLEVYQQDGKTYAVNVVKVIDKVKPEFDVGGFAAHCSNQEEVWEAAKIERQGTPFEVIEHNGFYGYFVNAVEYIRYSRIFAEEGQKALDKAKAKGKTVELVEDTEDIKVYRTYSPKKDGTPRKKFKKLGKLEKTCKFFFDYNF